MIFQSMLLLTEKFLFYWTSARPWKLSWRCVLLHSRLLERACRKIKELGGSITALPIIETQAGDISHTFRQTLFLSLTDRFSWKQICSKGLRPANVELWCLAWIFCSDQSHEKVAGTLKLDLAQFREPEALRSSVRIWTKEPKQATEDAGRRFEAGDNITPMRGTSRVVSLCALTRDLWTTSRSTRFENLKQA